MAWFDVMGCFFLSSTSLRGIVASRVLECLCESWRGVLFGNDYVCVWESMLESMLVNTTCF